jgi:hypothetical protein
MKWNHSDASPFDPSTSHNKEILDNVCGNLHFAEQVQLAMGATVRADDMKIF